MLISQEKLSRPKIRQLQRPRRALNPPGNDSSSALPPLFSTHTGASRLPHASRRQGHRSRRRSLRRPQGKRQAAHPRLVWRSQGIIGRRRHLHCLRSLRRIRLPFQRGTLSLPRDVLATVETRQLCRAGGAPGLCPDSVDCVSLDIIPRPDPAARPGLDRGHVPG